MSKKIRNPENLQVDLEALEKKLNQVLLELNRAEGNPFCFYFALGKDHILTNSCPTAGTNGKEFFWNPQFLDSLNLDDAKFVMIHEVYHIALAHCRRMTKGAQYSLNRSLVNIAMDYCVHAVMNKDGLEPSQYLGKAVSIDEYIAHCNNPSLRTDGPNVFYDPSCYGMSAQQIFKKIYDNIPQQKSEGSGEISGLDQHMEEKGSAEEIQKDISKAIKASQIYGKKSAGVDFLIDELEKPVINLQTILAPFARRKQAEHGMVNNWKRPRRRSLAYGYFMPSRTSYKCKVLVMLDTSGSMEDKLIKLAISQLKSLGDSLDVLLVPVDTIPYWDKSVQLTGYHDLNKIKIAGRGGTDFKAFFQDWPQKAGRDFDAIVVLTDGYVDMGQLKAPPIPTFWVVTPGNSTIQPPFGMVVPID